MQYKDRINAELKHIAVKVPYNKVIIRCANIYQTIALHVTKIPGKVNHSRFTIAGYRGLKCKVDVFEPSKGKEKLPVLLYVHGGAFSYKASAYHKKLACIYAAQAKCRVYFPDYHLTPKYKYPAACEDVLALYRWLVENAEELLIDSERIGVAGDSAGACIAAMICNQYEAKELKKPCLQMLVYPLTDIGMQTDSMKKYTDTPLWNAKNNRRMWQYYCGHLNGKDRYAASLMHGSLPKSIPDTYIETAEYDCLHDEGILYGKRLREAGANVTINETRGTIHGYDSALRTNIATRHIKKRILFLRKGFHE